MQLFYSPILGKGSCAVGIFTTGWLFAETSLDLFVSQPSLRALGWKTFNPVLLLFSTTKPVPKCLIVTSFKMNQTREMLTLDTEV